MQNEGNVTVAHCSSSKSILKEQIIFFLSDESETAVTNMQDPSDMNTVCMMSARWKGNKKKSGFRTLYWSIFHNLKSNFITVSA